MFLELIAVIFAGLAAAGVVMLLNRPLQGRLPHWMAPVAAGLAMIGVTIASEYGWYGRTAAGLPEGLVIAETVENRSLYRPWTYAVPYVDRFAALDAAAMRNHPDHPQVFLADMYFFGRWAAVTKLPVWLDCDTGRRALQTGEARFNDGLPEGLDWVQPGSADPILQTACGG